MKKNKKSTPTEKKFWIISIAVGMCLVVLAVCFFSNADKEKEEADLLDTVNYVKVQCSTYTHYNESSESKSLLRAIEGTRQVSKNIAAETENEKHWIISVERKCRTVMADGNSNSGYRREYSM